MIKTGLYKHFKGGTSLVLCTAKHSNGTDIMVIYFGLQTKEFYARPLEQFIDKFDVNGTPTPRFEFIQEVSPEEQNKILYGNELNK